MDVESLYPLVTESIRRAELLEEPGAPGAATAQLDVSLIEEKITESLPPSNPEGAIARRGAVRAALAAKDFARAHALATRFIAETGMSSDLKTELTSLATFAARKSADALAPSQSAA